MRRPDFGREVVLGKPDLHARHEIAAIGVIVGMLELAPAAFRKVPAGRLLVMWTEGERAIVEHRIARNAERDMPTAGRDAISARRNPDDQFVHKLAMACGMAFAKSSAIS